MQAHILHSAPPTLLNLFRPLFPLSGAAWQPTTSLGALVWLRPQCEPEQALAARPRGNAPSCTVCSPAILQSATLQDSSAHCCSRVTRHSLLLRAQCVCTQPRPPNEASIFNHSTGHPCCVVCVLLASLRTAASCFLHACPC